MDENLNVVPDLAEYWTVSDDKKVYSFKIRDDIFFHESEFFKNKTRKVNAFDFEYSFSRIIDENIASHPLSTPIFAMNVLERTQVPPTKTIR